MPQAETDTNRDTRQLTAASWQSDARKTYRTVPKHDASCTCGTNQDSRIPATRSVKRHLSMRRVSLACRGTHRSTGNPEADSERDDQETCLANKKPDPEGAGRVTVMAVAIHVSVVVAPTGHMTYQPANRLTNGSTSNRLTMPS